VAHYAFLDENNIVTEVITGVNEDVTQTDLDGTLVGGSSEAWETFYGNKREQVCKRTSYNGNIRKNYAGIGYIYDEIRDAFYLPQPYSSWILNEDTCQWESPVPYPNDDKDYVWDEDQQQWTEIEVPE
jgi:hypothetical protein